MNSVPVKTERVAAVCGLRRPTASAAEVLYCASKSLVHKLIDGLAIEAAAHGAFCTVSMPGFTTTEIFETSGWGRGIENSAAVRALMTAPKPLHARTIQP
jgi:short-subunit dehydrogenase